MALSTARDPSCSSSSNSTPPWKYHVFLSFRGLDTRRNFTDHLYVALQQRGIITFRDDEELERGEVISQEIVKAIEGSLSAIVVLSQNYASSTWCLDELQRILESKEALAREVFPVFYDVEPSDVRHLKGSFAKSFRKHEGRFRKDKEKVEKWRNALKKVAILSGWNSKGWHEAKLIEDIIELVWEKLCPKLSSYNDELVGIDSRIEKIDYPRMKLHNVRFMGIWGMGGIGKTTLARVLYERIRGDFEISCFLANVRETSEKDGVLYLQQKLLSHLKIRSIHIGDMYEGKKTISNLLCKKKVLLVLDDVSARSQLENLAGNRQWFGPGSIVIVTTRDMHVLTSHGISQTHKIEALNFDESLQLFFKKAFKGDQVKDGYLELSKRVVNYAKGLPLALEVLGSFLCEKSIPEWRDAMDKMEQVLDDDIMKILRVSYDGLEDGCKTIFLDIACFFKRMEKGHVIKILTNCGLNPTIGIKVLIEKSLVTIHGSVLEMHDLLQKMGRSIVCEESQNDVGNRSRLWSKEDIDQVLRTNKGTRLIQAIVQESSEQYEVYSNPKAFLKMCNLRLLVISDVHLPLGLKYLPDSIKVLAWEGYPLNVLPLGLHNELVDLKMHHSKITKPWDETQFFGKLKAIDLSHSNDLVQTPIVSGIPYLERLILEGCINLVEFHQSVGQHKKLVEVNMENCISLKIFPSKLEMSSLEEIILSGCSQVTKLPDFGENMERLLILNLKDCKNLLCLPNTIGNLKSLETLTISGCSKFSWLPNNIDETEAFEEIDVSGPSVRDLISSNSKGFQLPLKTFFRMSNLSLLKELDISYCNLGGGLVPDDFGCLSSLSRLNLSGNNFVNLPAYCIANLSNLYYLDLNSCPMLQTLPILPQDLYQLFARNCPSMEPLLDPLQLWNLYGLEDHKMISSLRPSCIITGNEIPPWFEHQSYAFHDMRLEQSGIDSIMSISVYIPQYCRSSEWWRIDVCLVLEFVASSSMRGSSPDHLSASIHLNVESTKQGVPSHEDSVYINKQFECPHLWITSLRGLQEHLRGETHQLQLIFFTKTHGGNHYLKIRKCGCHVYCKEDVQLWHRAKGYIENCPSFSSSTSTSTSSRSLIGKSSTSPSTSTSSSSLLGKSSTSTSSNSLIARLVQRTGDSNSLTTHLVQTTSEKRMGEATRIRKGKGIQRNSLYRNVVWYDLEKNREI